MMGWRRVNFCFVDLWIVWNDPAIIQNYKRDPQQHYIAVDGPANRNLDPPTMYQMGLAGWTLTYVTQNSQHKERAMQLITYLMTEEGHKTATLG